MAQIPRSTPYTIAIPQTFDSQYSHVHMLSSPRAKVWSPQPVNIAGNQDLLRLLVDADGND